MISTEELERLVAGYDCWSQVWFSDMDDLARELIAARKVVEPLRGLVEFAAKEADDYRACCALPSTGEVADEDDRNFLEGIEALVEAGRTSLAAYDEATS